VYRRGDIGQVARALRILNALRGYKQGRTLAELAGAVGVSERTVRRDLNDLNDADVEIELTRLDGRAAAVLVEASYSSVAITRRERYTLLAVRRMFDVLHGTPLAEDVESVLRKLEQRMTAQERTEHATFGERFAYIPDGGTKEYRGKEDLLDALLTGVLSRRLVRFAYQGARGRTQRGHLALFSMVVHKHGLYVVGRKVSMPLESAELGPGRVEVFAAERFREAECLRGATFVPPSNFKLGEVVHGAFGIHLGEPSEAQEVVIEFSKDRAAYVRARIWHPSQHLDQLAGGAVRLTFTCVNLSPVVSWVLEWGPHARAIEPPALVARVVEELDAARKNYE